MKFAILPTKASVSAAAAAEIQAPTYELTSDQTIELIAQNTASDAKEIEVLIPEILTKAHEFWTNKHDLESRKNAITQTLLLVSQHLSQLKLEGKLGEQISEEELGFLANPAKTLHSNLLTQAKEDVLVALMQQLISYVSLLSDEKFTPEERAEVLKTFPLIDEETDLVCIAGTKERMDAPFLKLQLKNLSYEAKNLLEAHEAIAGEAFHRFSSMIYEGNHPHVPFAIKRLLGVNDPKDFFGSITANMIPVDKAWQFYCDYFPALNERMERWRQEKIVQVGAKLELEIKKNKGIDTARKIPNPAPRVGESTRKEIKNEMFAFLSLEDAKVCYYDEDEDEELVRLENIPNLFPSIAIDANFIAKLPESLFAADAAQKIAALILSENPIEQNAGFKALSMIGNQHWVGNSPAQFYNILHEVFCQITPDHATFTDGDVFVGIISENLQRLAAATESPATKAYIKAALVTAQQYLTNDACTNYLGMLQPSEGAAEMDSSQKLLHFLLLNGSLTQVTQLVDGLDAASLEDALKKAFEFLGRRDLQLYHNPEFPRMLTYLFRKQDCDLEKNGDALFKIAKNLVNFGAEFNDLAMIHYVKSGFNTIAENPSSEFANFFNCAVFDGLQMCHIVRDVPQNSGLWHIATRDARELKAIIGGFANLKSKECPNGLDLGLLSANNGLLFLQLLQRSDSTNFQRLFDIGLSYQTFADLIKICVTQSFELRDGFFTTTAQLAAIKGNVAAIKLLKRCDNGYLVGRDPYLAYLAIANGHVDFLSELINCEGVDIENLICSVYNSMTPIEVASMYGRHEIVEMLWNKLNDYITLAFGGQGIQAIKDRGYDLPSKIDWTELDMSPAHLAAKGKHHEVMAVLIEKLREQNSLDLLTTPSKDGFTPAHYAAAAGDIEMMKQLKDVLGQDLMITHKKSGYRFSPFIKAIGSIQPEMMQWLLQNVELVSPELLGQGEALLVKLHEIRTNTNTKIAELTDQIAEQNAKIMSIAADGDMEFKTRLEVELQKMKATKTGEELMWKRTESVYNILAESRELVKVAFGIIKKLEELTNQEIHAQNPEICDAIFVNLVKANEGYYKKTISEFSIEEEGVTKADKRKIDHAAKKLLPYLQFPEKPNEEMAAAPAAEEKKEEEKKEEDYNEVKSGIIFDAEKIKALELTLGNSEEIGEEEKSPGIGSKRPRPQLEPESSEQIDGDSAAKRSHH